MRISDWSSDVCSSDLGRETMFSHVMVGADDVAASKAFYDAILGALGAKPGMTDDKGRVFYAHNGGLFMNTAPIDGAPACHANGGTIGFAAASPAEAAGWHAAGVAQDRESTSLNSSNQCASSEP